MLANREIDELVPVRRDLLGHSLLIGAIAPRNLGSGLITGTLRPPLRSSSPASGTHSPPSQRVLDVLDELFLLMAHGCSSASCVSRVHIALAHRSDTRGPGSEVKGQGQIQPPAGGPPVTEIKEGEAEEAVGRLLTAAGA